MKTENKMARQIKQRIIPSLIASFILPFVFFIFGPIDIFIGNKEEFTFAASDFIPICALIALAVFAALTALLLLMPEKIYPALLGLIFGTAFMSLIQSMFLNRGSSSLERTDMLEKIGLPFVIFDALLWLVVLSAFVMMAYRLRDVEWVESVALILAFVTVGASLIGTLSDFINIGGKNEKLNGVNYLSDAGINEVAPGKNVIVFILDRFDAKFYWALTAEYPDALSDLDGFTYFADNLSYFSATYPSICHMVTGAKQDFSVGANEYFTSAYDNSTFLADLKANDYSVRLYTGSYYAYRDGTDMTKYIDNASKTEKYVVVNRPALIKQMAVLSLFRYVPTFAKLIMPDEWFYFDLVTNVSESDSSVYEMDDTRFCAEIENGLELQSSEHENAYIFYHLNGLHYPYTTDENCQPTEHGNYVSAARGSFKIIYSYIAQLKEMGLYDDATIIITGDHSAGNNGEDAPPVNGTALFVKPAHSTSGEKLVRNEAQVCDDNIFATIVKSAGIKTEYDYGEGYFDIPEGEIRLRELVSFAQLGDDSRGIKVYNIVGPWQNNNSWVLMEDKIQPDFYR